MGRLASRRKAEREKATKSLRSLPAPQPGAQEQFIHTEADIAVFGGASGGGKTASLLISAAQHVGNPSYGAVIFRRNFTQITEEGALWDTAEELFAGTGAQFKKNTLDVVFPSGAKIGFAHMDNDSTRFNYQGSQIAFIGFDETTHFSAISFWYMLSRNRTTCGVKPVVRATCNPDADHWLRQLIDWWIGEDGYPIPERSGVIRYFVRLSDSEFLWGDSPDELVEQGVDRDDIYSFTFIRARLKDNKILTDKDPRYKARLKLLHPVERERLLGDEEKGGNWNAKLEEGTVFDRTWFGVVDACDVPYGGGEVSFWDFAATSKELAKKSSFYSARTKLKIVGGITYILDVYAEQIGPGEISDRVKAIAQQDGRACRVRWEQEGGSSGIIFGESLASALAGFDAAGIKPMGDKVSRAAPLATDASHGLVKLVRAPWNDRFLSAAQAFDGSPQPLTNDIIDSADGAYQVAKNLTIAASPQATEEKHSPRSLRKIF